jgi:hypothetical protein
MKSLDEIKRAISKIRIVDLNSNDAYSTIENIMKKDLVKFALPRKIFVPGLRFHRCSNNENNKDFESINRLSFRTDLDNITEFGRANMPKQSIFYSADVRPTAISETSKAFRGECYKDIDIISITTSHWESIKELTITLIVGNANAQEKNELVKKYNIDIDQLTTDIFKQDKDKILEILNFVSEEFATNTRGNSNLYKISCAFAQFAYQTSDGIIYPSLQRQFEGLNFAIKPDSIKEKLRFVNATHDKFKKVGEKEFMHIETKETIGNEGDKLIWGETKIIASR